MLRLFLLRFWPVLLPLLAYGVWFIRARRQAVEAGASTPRFRDGPWYWAILCSLFIAIVCFMLWGETSLQGDKGIYIPPHMENGALIPGEVKKP